MKLSTKLAKSKPTETITELRPIDPSFLPSVHFNNMIQLTIFKNLHHFSPGICGLVKRPVQLLVLDEPLGESFVYPEGSR